MKTITSERPGVFSALGKVYRYRALVLTLALRDLKIQYAQTLLGILWSILRPLSGLLIYWLFFGKLLKIDTGTIPYPLFAFAGMICWYYFSYLLGSAGTSLLSSQDIIKKIYFPKLILPFSKVLVGLVEFGIAFAILLIMMLYMGFNPQLKLIFIPIGIVLTITTALSVGIWLSALTIRFRDFHHIIPYLVNFGIFVTPVFYPATLIPPDYKFLLFLNPMAGILEGFRWMLFDSPVPSVYYAIGFIPVCLLFVGGLFYFVRIEGKMSDIV